MLLLPLMERPGAEIGPRLRSHLEQQNVGATVQVYFQSSRSQERPGLVPIYPLQKPPSRGLEGSGGEGGRGDEGLKVEGGFTFGRLQGGFKGA